MKLIMNEHGMIDKNSGVMLKGKKVGVSSWHINIGREELDTIIKRSEGTWKTLWHLSGYNDFKGVIRFDFVPEFTDTPTVEDNVLDTGPLSIRGLYEVNAESPECGAAISLMNIFTGQDRSGAIKKLVSEIKRSFGNERIVFVPGDSGSETSVVKMEWHGHFVQRLKECDLDIELRSTEEILCSRDRYRNRIIWRWGDINEDMRFCHYTPHFIEWLRNHTGPVFNTLAPEDKIGISDKSLLLSIGNNRVLSPSDEDVSWAMQNKDALVLKRFRGASGKDVFFGKRKGYDQWEALLKEKQRLGNFGLFEAMWLPKIRIPKNHGPYAFDINAAFWAENDTLRLLYLIIRMEEWETYEEKLTINVSAGSCMGEVMIEQ